ncbi:hypothetical protein D9615_000778 [Tricholomella constricta]|uniref:Uncharacterized protein n=1 Tax=Tricholomella constricta TaxID=117010 RepID=A0A8H5HQL3_9AGAR|nr:hypothetical protein D9615_000778 [Tricholomella constricta]
MNTLRTGNDKAASESWTNPNRNNTTNADSKLSFTIDVMRQDLTPNNDKPLWPLSTYGPAKYEPNLIAGLDESTEELRVRAFTANQSGKGAEYVAYENEKISAAEQVFANARNNLSQAYDQAVKQSTNAAGSSTTNPTLGGTSAFGAPASASAFGAAAPASAFGGVPASSSAFGAPASASAFGAPAPASAFGGVPASSSVFHIPPGTSAFDPPGTTSALRFGNSTTTSAFGKPAFGQPAFGQSAFGQTATPAGTSAFGQPSQSTSAFGQPRPAVSAFGQPQQPTSAFGQPSQPSASAIKPATGAFGSLNSSTSNAFGGGGFTAFASQPSAFGSGAPAAAQPAAGESAFGQPAFGAPATAQPTSAFGSAAGTTPSAFGTPAPAISAFGAPTTSSFGTAPAISAFGNPAPAPTTSAFGTPAAPTSAFGAPSAFGALAQQPTTTSAFGTSGFGTPATGSAFNTQGGTSTNAFTNSNNAITSSSAPPATTSAFPSSSSSAPAAIQPTLSGQPPPLSAFPMGSPSTSTFNAVAQAPPSKAGGPDFSNVKSLYTPGLTAYDQLLPPDYIKRIPGEALEAFQSQKFEWGKIPDWIPPLEVR